MDEFEIIYNKYTMRVENIHKEIIKSQNFLHPNFSANLVKITIPPNVPEDKRNEVEEVAIKKVKEEFKGQNLMIFKEITKISNDFVKKTIEEARKKGDKEEVLLGKRLETLISGRYNLFDTYFNNFKRGFNEIFSVFENFNNDNINLLMNLSKKEILKRRSIHNIYKVKEQFYKLIGININESFIYWNCLKYYFNIRNILVHNDGRINKIFLKIKYSLGIKFDETNIGNKIQIDKVIFDNVVNLVLYYFKHIFRLIQKNNIIKDDAISPPI